MDNIFRTERLEIVDKMGNCLAALGQEEDQFIGLTFYDNAQKKRLNIRVRENGNPEILLYDESESNNLRIRIFVNQRQEPKIMLTDGFDNIIKLAVSEDDEPVLELRDDNGDTRVGLFVTDEGEGIAVFDKEGDLVASLPKKADLLEMLGTAGKIIGFIRDIAS